MNPSDLDRMLDSLARQPLPMAPDVRASVRAEIQRRHRAGFWERLRPGADWQELFAEPRLVGVSLLAAFVIGTLPMIVNLPAAGKPEVQTARAALHLEIFSAGASGAIFGSAQPTPVHDR